MGFDGDVRIALRKEALGDNYVPHVELKRQVQEAPADKVISQARADSWTSKQSAELEAVTKDVPKEAVVGKYKTTEVLATPKSGRVGVPPVHGQLARAIGRGAFWIAALITLEEMNQATKESWRVGSLRPMTAESIRQVGSWGGAISGALILGAAATAAGLPSGPGALVVGVGGAIVGGYIGYTGADIFADQVYAN